MEMRVESLALTSNISVSWSEASYLKVFVSKVKCFLYRQSNDSAELDGKTVYPPDILDFLVWVTQLKKDFSDFWGYFILKRKQEETD